MDIITHSLQGGIKRCDHSELGVRMPYLHRFKNIVDNTIS